MPPTTPTAAPGNVPATPATGLLLTGGGARAAYQVGVLEAIADLRQACGEAHGPNPFPIITGTSAGAINAAALGQVSENAQAFAREHGIVVLQGDAVAQLLLKQR